MFNTLVSNTNRDINSSPNTKRSPNQFKDMFKAQIQPSNEKRPNFRKVLKKSPTNYEMSPRFSPDNRKMGQINSVRKKNFNL